MHGDVVNGKQYWMQENGQGAIWYDSKYGNWKIGSQSDIGSINKDIFSYSADNIFGPQGVTKWKYMRLGKSYFDDNSGVKVKIAGTLFQNALFTNIIVVVFLDKIPLTKYD